MNKRQPIAAAVTARSGAAGRLCSWPNGLSPSCGTSIRPVGGAVGDALADRLYETFVGRVHPMLCYNVLCIEFLSPVRPLTRSACRQVLLRTAARSQRYAVSAICRCASSVSTMVSPVRARWAGGIARPRARATQRCRPVMPPILMMFGCTIRTPASIRCCDRCRSGSLSLPACRATAAPPRGVLRPRCACHCRRSSYRRAAPCAKRCLKVPYQVHARSASRCPTMMLTSFMDTSSLAVYGTSTLAHRCRWGVHPIGYGAGQAAVGLYRRLTVIPRPHDPRFGL